MATSSFQLLRPKTLMLTLTPLFLSYPTPNPSANPTGSSFKIYLESNHLTPFHWRRSKPLSSLTWTTKVASSLLSCFLSYPCSLRPHSNQVHLLKQIKSCCSSALNYPKVSQQILNKIQILTMEYKALQTPFPVLFPIHLSQHSPYTGLKI